MNKTIFKAVALASSLILSIPTFAIDIAKGEKIVQQACAACHASGVMGAPKLGNNADWAPRAKQGMSKLMDHAINGFNSMPARGGQPQLTDQQLEDAVAAMLKGANISLSKAKKATKKKAVAKKTPKKKIIKKLAKKAAKPAKAMRFNRLMKPPSEWNPPPFEDGIHDPEGEGAYMLQTPKEAFESLNKSSSGNRVDWVKSLNNNKIDPRWDRTDPTKKAFVMDLNIVREVKGSMPNVVYPHKQHTQWLDCSNCHPDIFIPKKGANQISMAAILMGQACGVCHGKVAFPVSECRKCHSQKKKKKPVRKNKNNAS
jgi:c(7)-type cytochrome triheme protein